MLGEYAIEVAARARSEEYRKWAQDLLLELVSIDNTPKADVDLMRRNEDEVFKVIEREVGTLCGCMRPKAYRVPIDVELISGHQYVTPPHYTKTPEKPNGLPIVRAYAGRSNLVVVLDGADGMRPDGPTVCSHVDTVAPYLNNVRADAGIVHGRGACDDKGSIVSIIEAMRLMSELGEKIGSNPLGRSVVSHFVIDEEPGGNGALSLSLSEKWTSDNILVTEITDLIPHRANRGALWYRVDLIGTGPGFNSLIALAHIVLSLEAEGERILEETPEGIFLKEHVQTSHGIIAAPSAGDGPEVAFGQHPSTVNGYVKLAICTEVDPKNLRGDIEESTREYVAKYGDKTLEIDPETRLPKVARHFSIVRRDAGGRAIYDVEVFGKTGHMGAIRHCDCAIIKMAYVLTGLQRLAKEKGATMDVFLTGAEDLSYRRLVLEGGQGFTAVHDLAEIQSRIISAVDKGIGGYLARTGLTATSINEGTSFDKLHNDAYESPEGSAAWGAMLDACRLTGIRLSGQERRAWRVSCDARLYAKAPKALNPSKGIRNVFTFGAGSLKYAHSEAERVSVSDVLLAGSTIALWAMKMSGG